MIECRANCPELKSLKSPLDFGLFDETLDSPLSRHRAVRGPGPRQQEVSER